MMMSRGCDEHERGRTPVGDTRIAGVDMAEIVGVIWATPLCREVLAEAPPAVRIRGVGSPVRYNARSHTITICRRLPADEDRAAEWAGTVINRLVCAAAHLVTQRLVSPLLASPEGIQMICDRVSGLDTGRLRDFRQAGRHAGRESLRILRGEVRVAFWNWLASGFGVEDGGARG